MIKYRGTRTYKTRERGLRDRTEDIDDLRMNSGFQSRFQKRRMDAMD